MSFNESLGLALLNRKALFERLHEEGTTAYRLFHGISEGRPGLAIDRYGSTVLIQTFREPLDADELGAIEARLRADLKFEFSLAYHPRGEKPAALRTPDPGETLCQEFGLKFLFRAHHSGMDPWLFLDLRAGRRFLRQKVAGKTVLNLFSYTCSIGLTAAAARASEVLNVDFSKTNLEIGRKNAQLNSVPETIFHTLEEDCLPVMRQLAGLEAGGRKNKRLKYKKLNRRQFDCVILDPPAWSKGSFGAVDVEGDYPSLFKPAVLATKPGGWVMATHHVPTVDFDSWVETLKKCAAKAGRPIQSVQRISPEEDFPSFDGNPPLKIAVCEV